MLWDEKLVVTNGGLLQEIPSNMRKLGYVEALREAIDYKMSQDPSTFLLGQGVDDPGGMFGVTKGYKEIYGPDRVFDTPVSEEGMTGIATGAAMHGMRPIYFHNRPDFWLLAFNQIVSHASKMHYMDNGQTSVPLVMWAAIGRGWGSGPQHSQAIQGLLIGVPGLKIVMPSTPYDAKGLLISAIEDNNPVLILEHRWLMKREGPVPLDPYRVEIGKGVIRRVGDALTVVGISHAIDQAWTAASQIAAEENIAIEVIDLRSVKPLDKEMIFASVEKTGKLLIVDTGWCMGGVTAEIGCLVAENALSYLKAPICRIGLPDSPSPAGYALEQFYYPNVQTIKKTMLQMVL